MSQPASSESYPLHPILAAALGSLDVTLDSELAQYRCHQTVKRLSPAGRQVPKVPQSAPAPSAPQNSVEKPPLSPSGQQASSSPGYSPISWSDQAISLETETESLAESTPAPEDYLASSQALLKNLDSERSAQPQRQRYLTPMAIVSLGLLVASFPVAYWIIQSSDRSPQPSLSSPAPSIASSETPAASPTLSPGTAASPSPPPVAADPPPPALRSGDNYYYVVADNASPRSLEQMRRIVPEAYVRDFPEGPQIQVGAYDSRQPAEDIVQFLKRQGVAATIREPR